MKKPGAFFLLLLIALPIAGTFGILHDQISYTVSPEYFTKFKFIQFGLTQSPLPDRVRAGMVGLLASWWMGIPIGLLIAPFALMYRTGAEVLRAGLAAFAVSVACTLAIALGGFAYGYGQTKHIDLQNYEGWFIPDHLVSLRRFLCVGYMHNSAYLGGIISILVAWIVLLVCRFRTTANTP